MTIPTLRRYAGLVREGPGNERERLALRREHLARVQAALERQNRCLDLIDHKVGVYEDIIAGARPDS